MTILKTVTSLYFMLLLAFNFQRCSNDGTNGGSNPDVGECREVNAFSEISSGSRSSSVDWSTFDVIDQHGYYESFGKSFVLYITNFKITTEMTNGSFGTYSPVKGQNMIQIILSRPVDGEFKTGFYDRVSDKNHLSCYLIEGGDFLAKSIPFTSGPVGSAIISSIDKDDRVCGIIDLKTTGDNVALVGEFSVKIR